MLVVVFKMKIRGQTLFACVKRKVYEKRIRHYGVPCMFTFKK